MPDSTISSTWTRSYVVNNFDECSDGMLTVLRVGARFLNAGEYKLAAEAWENLVNGLEMLADISSNFNSYLYANLYSLGKIYVFGLGDYSKAIASITKACTYATKSGSYKDCNNMTDFLSEVKARKAQRELCRIFDDIDFPYDIVSQIL